MLLFYSDSLFPTLARSDRARMGHPRLAAQKAPNAALNVG